MCLFLLRFTDAFASNPFLFPAPFSMMWPGCGIPPLSLGVQGKDLEHVVSGVMRLYYTSGIELSSHYQTVSTTIMM